MKPVCPAPRAPVWVGFLAIGLAVCSATSAAAPKHRLPNGWKWGRCLLVVNGKTRISGKCAYTITKGGEFGIDGPQQIYGGIDYPKPELGADEQSRDYWASVKKDEEGWYGYGNDDITWTHAQTESWRLQKQGSCFIGKGENTGKGSVRLCLWQK